MKLGCGEVGGAPPDTGATAPRASRHRQAQYHPFDLAGTSVKDTLHTMSVPAAGACKHAEVNP